MNRRVITIMIVIALAALVTLAVVYAPSLFEAMLQFHKVPRH